MWVTERMFKRGGRASAFALVLAAGLLLACGGLESSARAGGAAQKQAAGGQPVPRFVSLKSDEVNVRRGPGWDHSVTWVFRRAGLPVEVLAEFESWRQVRDSEGATGWVFSTLLSGHRTSLVAPGAAAKGAVPLYDKPSASSSVRANLESGLLVNIKSCDGRWCSVVVNDASGWIDQNLLWGVYPNEVIE
jgi:SH3-like domain-containing protein